MQNNSNNNNNNSNSNNISNGNSKWLNLFTIRVKKYVAAATTYNNNNYNVNKNNKLSYELNPIICNTNPPASNA